VDKPVDSVEKLEVFTVISQKLQFLRPIFAVLIAPICAHKNIIFRVTETAFRGQNSSVFGEKVAFHGGHIETWDCFSSFFRETL
jgi:hypothetical protein